MKKICVVCEKGPVFLKINVTRRRVTFRDGEVIMELFFEKPRSVSGWPLRELWIPRSLYWRIRKNVLHAGFVPNEANIHCSFSDSGRSIIISVACSDASHNVSDGDHHIFFLSRPLAFSEKQGKKVLLLPIPVPLSHCATPS